MLLAPAMAALVRLEEEVAAAIAADGIPKPRVYEWRTSALPQLPAIWNWINPSDHDVVDTGREDDLIVITTSLGVRPADLGETMGRLTRMTDHFRTIVDPALKTRPVLGGTVRSARRTLTSTRIDEFMQGGDDVPVMCMDMTIHLQLSHFTG